MAGSRNKDNQSSVKHGGEGAIRRISQGQPLIGIARDMQLEVEDSLETQGIEAIVCEGATRLETAARLYWNAVVKAAETGDLESLDRFCARYGWLQSKALLAWSQVKQDRKAGGGKLAEVLDAYRNAQDAPREAQTGQAIIDDLGGENE